MFEKHQRDQHGRKESHEGGQGSDELGIKIRPFYRFVFDMR